MAHPRPGDSVKVHYTGRLDDGNVFDSSKKRDPIELTVGEGQVIPGFEEALAEMEPGQERTVKIPADRAYGPHRPELLVSIDRETFPDSITPEKGQKLQVRQNDGQIVVVTVTDVSEREVTLDANHPLAGHDLTFDLELVEIRQRK